MPFLREIAKCAANTGIPLFQIETMENWQVTSFMVTKTVAQKSLGDQSLPLYGEELAVSFTSYRNVDLKSTSIYFAAPEDFLRNQINSYGGKLQYSVTYGGYNMEEAPKAPDVILVGAGFSLLYHSGESLRYFVKRRFGYSGLDLNCLKSN